MSEPARRATQHRLGPEDLLLELRANTAELSRLRKVLVVLVRLEAERARQHAPPGSPLGDWLAEILASAIRPR